jgi:hypothetical protein
VEALFRTWRGLCDAYSQALPSLALAKASLLFLNTETWHPRPRPAVTDPIKDMVEVRATPNGSREYGWIGVPADFAQLPKDDQRRHVLRMVHQAAVLRRTGDRGRGRDVTSPMRKRCPAEPRMSALAGNDPQDRSNRRA